MAAKLIVGLLVLTVLGAVGIGVYDASQNDDAADVLLDSENDSLAVGLEAAATQTSTSVLADTPAAARPAGTPIAQAVEAQQALDQVGDPWAGSGTIAGFDEAGMTLAMPDTALIYVELGPQHYWSGQEVALLEGDNVTVTGFYNGEQYHAAMVTKVDGSQLVLRTAEGLPLWSGGASGNSSSGAHDASTVEPLVAAEDWITLEGTIATVSNNALTVQTLDGKALDLQLGQPRFVDDQGISFAAGESIRVIGYWQATTFKAGEIVKLATGERLMLLDPNGRPLWGGPGRNGATQGQTAQSGNPTGDTPAVQADSAVQGQGQSSGSGNGGGNGYQGGRNPDFQAGNSNQVAQ